MAGRKRQVSDEQILAEFYLADDPALVAKELTTGLDMSRQGVDDRLRQLEQSGYLHSKKPGRDRIYWLTQDGRAKAREHLSEKKGLI